MSDQRINRSSESHPKERSGDKGWRRFVRENWYRDVWLFIVSVVDVIAIISALNAANDAKTNVAAIQDSRIALTRDACVQQNSRHDNTIARLNKLIAEIPDSSQRQQAQKNVRATISLIDALVPKQNCDVLIRQRFGQGDK